MSTDRKLKTSSPKADGERGSCSSCPRCARCTLSWALLAAAVCGVVLLVVMRAVGAQGEDARPAGEGSPRLVTLKGIQFDLEGRRIVMDGHIALTAGVVELFACVRGTKDYESIVALDCQPYDLHLGLLALGLKPGRSVSRQEAGESPEGPTVLVWVEWKDADGRQVRRRAEDLVLNVTTKKPMESAGWAFVGSRFVKATSEGKEVYAAALTGAVITTYHDPTTVLDNPRPTGDDDTLFVVNESAVPAAGTPVRVVVEPEKKTDASARK